MLVGKQKKVRGASGSAELLEEALTYSVGGYYRCKICGCGPWRERSTVREHFELLGYGPEHIKNYSKFLEECRRLAKKVVLEARVCWSCGASVAFKGAKFCSECGCELA
jgi:hypothetical protein